MGGSNRTRTINTVSSDCAKIAFASKADGRRYIKKHRGNNGFSAKHVYQCRIADHWHITSGQAQL